MLLDKINKWFNTLYQALYIASLMGKYGFNVVMVGYKSLPLITMILGPIPFLEDSATYRKNYFYKRFLIQRHRVCWW